MDKRHFAMTFALVLPLQAHSSLLGPVANRQGLGHGGLSEDAKTKTVTQIIDSWIKANRWAWEDDESQRPSQIVEGHILSPDSPDLVALFSVSDGGTNITQYIYIFTVKGNCIEPINVYRVGQKGTALVDSIRTESFPGFNPGTAKGSPNLVIQGKIYNDGSNGSEADPECCPSLIRQWPVYVGRLKISYTQDNSPFTQNKTNLKQAPLSNEESNRQIQPKTMRPRVLSPEESREAEQLYAQQVGRPPKNNPQRYYQFQLMAQLSFVTRRALKRVGYTPGGIDYFYRILAEKENQRGLLYGYEDAFQIAKDAVWSKRDWGQEGLAKAKIKVLDKAQADVRQLLTEDFK